jgi:exonuclease III
MKIISWNCRGMGSKIKEEAIRNLIRIEAPDILLLQETKMEDSDFLQTSKKLWNKSKATAVSARGASGGLGTLWNDSKFSLVSETSNTHWLMLKMQHLVTKEIFCLFNVYVRSMLEKKRSVGTQ